MLGETHHFRSDTANFFPDRSIRVDSMTALPGDSVLYLTRYLEELGPGQAVANRPGFCQREMHLLPNGWYQFTDPGNIAVHAVAALNDAWLLDSNQAITATVERIWSGTVLGQPDSLKLLRLTGGDSLILSQNHGIVEWPAVLGAGHFQLVGLQQQALGDRYPTFDEWFPYQVGQTFFWDAHYSIWDGYINDYYGHIKLEVQSVVRDSVGVQASGTVTREIGISINGNPLSWSPVYTYPGVLFTIYDHAESAFGQLHKEAWRQPDSILVYYNEQLYDLRRVDMAPQYLAQNAQAMLFNTISKVELSQDGPARVLDIGKINGMTPGSYELGGSDTLNAMLWDGCEFRIRSGLGLEHVKHQGIDDGGYANLVGYITATGDTVGSVWRTWFIVGTDDATALNVQVFPNPAVARTSVQWPSAAAWSLELLDAQGVQVREEQGSGKAYELDVAGLPAGIYLLRMHQGGISGNRRLVIAR